MTERVQPEPAQPEAVPDRGTTLFGLLAAPAAYAVVAVLNYFVAPAACQFGSFGYNAIRLITFVVTVVGLLVILWGGYRAYRNVRQAKSAGAEPANTARFLGVGGLMLSVLFFALTVIAGLSGLALQPCQPV